jgi:hypothetical protein
MQENEGMAADQFRLLIGAPPLMKGESAEEYWNWWAAFAEDHKPKTLSDWFETNELAQKRWEERRLQRCASARVDSVLGPALIQLLKLQQYSGIPESLSQKYYSNNENENREARKIIESFGITEDQIRAEAMQECGRELLIFDRMEDYRARATRQLRKDIDRRSDARRTPLD